MMVVLDVPTTAFVTELLPSATSPLCAPATALLPMLTVSLTEIPAPARDPIATLLFPLVPIPA
ncbi:hypothetical protein WJ50_00350 [Burkholderia ubonensis]|nr:hypothetical protein WJ50_00350 [Burkholderia ubonensis]OJA27082.1 hypothetical protein BGV58_19505 [Burkholderia ubonensis]